MFCKNCGNIIPDSAKFCTHCGAPVKDIDYSQTSETNLKDSGNIPKVNQGDIPDSGIKNDKTGQNKIRPRNVILVIVIVVIVFVAGIIIGLNIRSEASSTIVSEEQNADAESPVEEESAEETEIAAQEKGVTRVKETDPERSTPEEYVAYVYENYLISDINAEGFWDDCVSEFSQELGHTTKDSYVDNIVNNVNLYGLSFISYEADSAEDMGDGVYEVDGTLKYKIFGSQETISDTMYVVSEGDQYKILLDGIDAVQSFTSDLSSGDIGISEVEVYYQVDGNIEVTCVVENHTSSDIDLGWTRGSQIEIELANGETRYTELPSGIKITAGSNKTLTFDFSDVREDISKMTIHNVNTLTSNGLPTDIVGNGSDVTITFD